MAELSPAEYGEGTVRGAIRVMAVHKANINPEILAWAREEAELSLDEAAHQAKVSKTKDKTPEERLEELERGVDTPTQNQLANIAKAYYRPILTFYMPTPPAPNNDVADFRTVADGAIGKLPPKLRALVSRMKARQQEILDLLMDAEEEEQPEPLPFVGRFEINSNVETVARDIEEVLNLPLERRQRINDRDALFRLLRYGAEDAGVFVLAQGDLGSHQTDIEPSVFRGFALADPIAPFVVLNDNDAKPAQTFTLIHELAHIWIGDTGVSNFDPFRETPEGSNEERFCNRVSAEFLMPREAMVQSWDRARNLPLHEAIPTIANDFGVSRAAVGIRLLHMGEVEAGRWWPLFNSYKRDWETARRNRAAAQDDPPPLYYPMKKSQLGGRLITTVLNALDAGRVTYTRASRILGVAPNGFDGLRPKA